VSAGDRSGIEADFVTEGAVGEGGKTLAGVAPGSDGHDRDSARLRKLSAEINREFPLRLDHTVLVLYDLDPEHLQVQWSIAPDDLLSARTAFTGESADVNQVLRLCRLDEEGGSEVVDRFVAGASGSMLRGHQRFSPGQLGAQYQCELGLESGDGGWLMLERSNRIRLSGRHVSSESNAREAGLPTHLPSPGHDGTVRRGEPGEYPVEPALATEGRSLHPVFPSPGAALAKSPVRHTLDSHVSDEGSWDDPDPLALAKEEKPLSLEQSIAPMAMMPPPLLPSTRRLARSADDASVPRYDPRAALSSAALRDKARKADELKVQAELVVHGCARPGALIELFGLAIRVGEDGRFSVRCPVADPLILSQVLGEHRSARLGDMENSGS